ncbi:MAG: hypothetical protein ACKOQY_02340 [Bacteroidota bacterium]
MNTPLAIEILLASAFSASLYVVLRYFGVWKVNNLHGLTANYLTAASLSFCWNFSANLHAAQSAAWMVPYAVGIGMLFIGVFYIAALTTQKAGITITSIAGKMSMVIPICAGIILFNDQVTSARIIGMLLALLAVLLSTYSKSKGESHQKIDAGTVLLPVILFIGSGMVDTSIKLSEHYLMEGEGDQLFVSMLFGSAGLIGIVLTFRGFLFSRFERRKAWPNRRSILAGVLLGTLNFFSLLFLINALASPGAESSLIFAITNVLVVLFSTASGLILFREKLNPTKIAGLAVAIISIIILSR